MFVLFRWRADEWVMLQEQFETLLDSFISLMEVTVTTITFNRIQAECSHRPIEKEQATKLNIRTNVAESLPSGDHSSLWMVVAAEPIRVSIRLRLHHHPFLSRLPDPKRSANATHRYKTHT